MRPAAGWRSAVVGGTAGAVASIAIVITLGLVALAPLQAGAAGVTAAFLCVIFGASVYALLAGSALPTGGPTSATAVIAAALVARLADSPALPQGPDAVPAALAALGLAVLGMGLLQVLMAVARLGSLVRFVPHPVLAGFMNGVAILIVLAQVPVLLGLDAARWAADGLRALHAAQPGALLLGLATAGLIVILARRAPRWPAALVGLALATVVWHIAAAALPGPWLGPTLAAVSPPPTWPGPLAALLGDARILDLARAEGGAVLSAALVLALVGSLETMLNLRALAGQTDRRHDENRELLAMGLGNVVGGLFGALPMVLLRARAQAVLQAGGIGRSAALVAAAVSLLLLTAGGGLLALLPKAALAGAMLVVAVSLVDGWSRNVLRQRGGHRAAWTPALLTMALVTLATVALGPVTGVAVGIALSVAVFVRRIRGQTLRWSGTARERPSRRVYPLALEQALAPLRSQIAVLELQGAVFWGNAESVVGQAEAAAKGRSVVVLDLRRVGAVDESAAVELLHLERRLASLGVTLLMAGPAGPVTDGRPWGDYLAEAGGGPPLSCWPDADRAIEHAERILLAEAGAGAGLLAREVPPEENLLLRDLSPRHAEAVLRLLQPRRLAAGEWLFREGDPADAVYLLTNGSITVAARGGTRYASFSPGTMLGELAVLDGGDRSADAVADVAAEVQVLPCGALAQLTQEDPALAALLYRQIAGHLANRLRQASAAWRDAAG